MSKVVYCRVVGLKLTKNLASKVVCRSFSAAPDVPDKTVLSPSNWEKVNNTTKSLKMGQVLETISTGASDAKKVVVDEWTHVTEVASNVKEGIVDASIDAKERVVSVADTVSKHAAVGQKVIKEEWNNASGVAHKVGEGLYETKTRVVKAADVLVNGEHEGAPIIGAQVVTAAKKVTEVVGATISGWMHSGDSSKDSTAPATPTSSSSKKGTEAK